MAKKRSRDLRREFEGDSQTGAGMQIDYSYNQWRHARMHQLERNYELQCERDFRL